MSPGEALNDASSINDSPWPSLPPWGVWYTDAGSVNVMVTVELGSGGVTREPELKMSQPNLNFSSSLLLVLLLLRGAPCLVKMLLLPHSASVVGTGLCGCVP